MADRIQQRRDTAARWSQYNPILLEGEIGYVTDNPNQYKIGDGVHTWNDLPLRGYTGTISQELGDDENSVISQKTVTDELNTLNHNFRSFIISLVDKIFENNDGNFSIVDGDGNIVLRIDEDGLKAFVLNICNSSGDTVGVLNENTFERLSAMEENQNELQQTVENIPVSENNDGNFSIVDGDGNIVLRIDEDGLKAFVLNIMNADEKVGVVDAAFFQSINNIIPKEKEVNILIASQSLKIGENAGFIYYIPIDVKENDILRIELVHTDSVWPLPIILYKDLSDEENVQTIYDRNIDGTGTGIIKETIVNDTYKYIRLAGSITTTLTINVYKVENRVVSDTTENADKISNIQSVYHTEDHMVMGGGENPLSLIKETPGLCGIIHNWGLLGIA